MIEADKAHLELTAGPHNSLCHAQVGAIRDQIDQRPAQSAPAVVSEQFPSPPTLLKCDRKNCEVFEDKSDREIYDLRSPVNIVSIVSASGTAYRDRCGYKFF